MKPPFEDTWLRVVANDAVSPADEAQLLAELQRDDDAWEQLVADQRMNGILCGLSHAAATEDQFLSATLSKWQAAHVMTGGKVWNRRPPVARWVAVATGLAATVALAALFLPKRHEPLPQKVAQPPAPAPWQPRASEAPMAIDSAAPAEGESGAAASTFAVRILGLDFEDGEVPDLLTTGGVVAGPAREGNQYCAIGGVSPWTLQANVVALTGGPQGLLGYHANRSLRFRYWVGADATRIVVQAKNLLQDQNFNAAIAPLVHGEWGWASLPFTALEPFDQRRQMRNGDALVDILIMAGTMGRSPFYIDDIEIVEARENIQP